MHIYRPQRLATSPATDDNENDPILSTSTNRQQLALHSSCHVYNGLKFSVSCTYNYTNKGPTDVWLLQRGTPLEGLVSNFLRVKYITGYQLSYQGVMIHRLTEDVTSNDEFVGLFSKQTISVTVDISTVYNFTLPGQYSIRYSSPIVYKESLYGKVKEISITNCIATIQIKDNAIIRGQHQLVINLVRSFLRHIPLCRPMHYKGVCRPTFIAMPSKEFSSQTMQIHKTVYTYIDPAIETISKDSQHFIRWFGLTSNRKNVQRVKGIFQDIKATLTSRTFAYAYDGMMCKKKRVLAYTWKGVRAIILCPLQYREPSILHPYSQLATALHEMTHSIGFTSDISYKISTCLKMAIAQPYLAVNNAASYGFYFSTILPVKYGIDSIGEYGNVMFMTKGPIYLKYTNRILDCNYPKLIKNHWGRIPAEFHDGFDTMLISKQGEVFVTKNSLFLRYSSLSDGLPQVEHSIKTWPGIPSSFRNGFDASVQLSNSITYFTRGSQYIRVSNFPNSLRIDAGYPKSLADGNWAGTSNLKMFESNLDAITSTSHKLCFFKSYHYFCFNPTQYSQLLPRQSPTSMALSNNVGKLHFCY